MTDDAETTKEPLFRANKRRKIFRKRDADDEDDRISTGEALSSSATASHAPPVSNETPQANPLRTVRKPAAKRYGIGFSNSDKKREDDQDGGKEIALFSESIDSAPEVPQIDRFIKPTGRVGVAEDKHLTAYIDSKLADLRTASSTTPSESKVPNRDATDEMEEDSTLPPSTTDKSTNPSSNRAAPNFSHRNHARNPKRPRRGPKPRDPSSLARDSLVEQILSESQVPMYTPTASSSAPHAPSDSANPVPPAAEQDDVDNDEAAAQAFKAAFLVDLQQRSRRRPPAAPASGSKKAQQTQSHGPKLGGSRSQREKMRAAEEAKKAGGSGGRK